MFRRREDGTEELINDNDSTAAVTTSGAPAAASASASTAATPSVPSTPVSQPSPASFRPVPPQAAMAAASRSAAPATSSVSSSSHSASEPTRSAAVPMSRPNTPSNKRVLTVGPDIQMKGEITSCDRVVIEGMVDATMRDVHTVELAETGALKGTAEVEDAEISGSFEGDITVRGKLTVYASGRIRGNVIYGEIEIQRGGQISGNIRNSADAKAGANTQHAKKVA